MSEIIPLGDNHFGKCTRLIRDNGTEYIEKPRNAHTEKVWASFLCKLSELGMENLPGCVEITSESENSHTEKIVENTPTDADGVKRYCRRFGTLLFLTYILSSTDFHAENIIASGEYPVLCDLEALLSSNIERSNNKRGILATSYASSLLPKFSGYDDTSGGTGKIESSKNKPIVDGKEIDISEYSDEIIRGFSEAYDVALQNREKIAEYTEDFSDCKFREITRNTVVYGYVIDKIKDARDKRIAAEKLLSRAFIHDPDKNRINQAALQLKAEIDSVIAGYVPLFHVFGGSVDLYYGDTVVMKNFYEVSPVEFAKNKITALSDTDKQKEIKIIELSFAVKKPLPDENSIENGDKVQKFSEQMEALRVPSFPSLYAYFSSENGRVASLKGIGTGLYSGLAGILCAYSAIYAKTRKTELLSKIDECISEIEKEFFRMKNGTIFDKLSLSLNDKSCGFSNGIAGTLSGLLHSYELTKIDRIYALALEIANSIDYNNINCKNIDVLGGAGGMAIILPKLPENIASPIAKKLYPILSNAECTLTGAGHGAAGVALALSALGKVLGDNSSDKAILKLLKFENSHYDADKNNWHDLRDTDAVHYVRGWCSGAPGIGMCRKKLLEYTDNEEIKKICNADIEKVKDFIKNDTEEYVRATLCCGESSRVMAAARLGVKIPNTLNNSYSYVSKRLFHILGTADRNPTLMQGLSGVAYADYMSDDERAGGMLL